MAAEEEVVTVKVGVKRPHEDGPEDEGPMFPNKRPRIITVNERNYMKLTDVGAHCFPGRWRGSKSVGCSLPRYLETNHKDLYERLPRIHFDGKRAPALAVSAAEIYDVVRACHSWPASTARNENAAAELRQMLEPGDAPVVVVLRHCQTLLRGEWDKIVREQVRPGDARIIQLRQSLEACTALARDIGDERQKQVYATLMGELLAYGDKQSEFVELDAAFGELSQWLQDTQCAATIATMHSAGGRDANAVFTKDHKYAAMSIRFNAACAAAQVIDAREVRNRRQTIAALEESLRRGPNEANGVPAGTPAPVAATPTTPVRQSSRRS